MSLMQQILIQKAQKAVSGFSYALLQPFCLHPAMSLPLCLFTASIWAAADFKTSECEAATPGKSFFLNKSKDTRGGLGETIQNEYFFLISE